MTRTERASARPRQGTESRQAILEATLAIASERGYDGTTIALVTDRTGLPASSIYWHFGSKDKLLAATLEHSYRQWQDAIPTWRTRTEPVDLTARVRRRFDIAARTLVESPQFWSLGMMLSLRAWVAEPAALHAFKRFRAETEKQLAAWWSGVLDPRAIERDPELPYRLGRFWIVMMDGMHLQLGGSSAAGSTRLFDRLISGFTRYLVATGVADDG